MLFTLTTQFGGRFDCFEVVDDAGGSIVSRRKEEGYIQ